MKKLVLVVMAMVFSMTCAFAADAPKSQKDECLLASKNCMNQADSIQQKMRKLQKEIDKGTKVYSPQELKKLENKLKDAENTLDTILEGGN